jgi:hypothetical protein
MRFIIADWSDEDLALLIRLDNEGLSPRDIAGHVQFIGRFSRSAILGKIFRAVDKKPDARPSKVGKKTCYAKNKKTAYFNKTSACTGKRYR